MIACRRFPPPNNVPLDANSFWYWSNIFTVIPELEKAIKVIEHATALPRGMADQTCRNALIKCANSSFTDSLSSTVCLTSCLRASR